MVTQDCNKAQHYAEWQKIAARDQQVQQERLRSRGLLDEPHKNYINMLRATDCGDTPSSKVIIGEKICSTN